MSRRSARRQSAIGPIIGSVFLGAALVGSVLLLRGNDRTGGFSAAMADVAGVFGGVITAPARWVGAGFDGLADFFGGAARIRQLEGENEALRAWRDQAVALRERLAAYEKLHNIAGEPLPRGVTGRMVGETSTIFSKAGIVNLGAQSGVEVNWIAVNQYGLVGRVIAVGDRSARILLLDDGTSRVPVMGEITRARAMIGGDSAPAPRLTHLNIPTTMRDGERVVTSGDDGIFPRGIAVGQAGIAPDRQWRVRLASRTGPIDFVRLLPPSRFPIPQDQLTPPSLAPPPPNVSSTQAAGALATLGGVMPLAPGAAPVPAAATPQAIAQAQQALELTKKLTAERDAAREAARRAEQARKAAEERAARATKVNAQKARPSASTPVSTPKSKNAPTELADPNKVPVAPAALEPTPSPSPTGTP